MRITYFLAILLGPILNLAVSAQSDNLTISKDSITTSGYENSSEAFIITSNVSWTVSSSQDWVLVKRAGEIGETSNLSGSGTAAIVLSVQENSTGSSREAQISVKIDNSEKILKLTQLRTTPWQEVFNGYYGGDHINAFAVDSSTGFFYAATWTGLKISTDKGLSWEDLKTDLPNQPSTALGIQGNRIFAGISTGIYMSENYGANWINKSNGLQPLVRAIAFKDLHIFAATDFGVFRSEDNGDNWVKTSEGLTTGLTASLLIHKDSIFVGTFRGVFLSTDLGNTWTAFNSGLPEQHYVSSIVHHRGDYYAGTANQGIFLWSRDSTEWIPVSTEFQRRSIRDLASDGEKLYAGVFNGGVFVSSDKGHTWNELNEGLTNKEITSFALYDNTLLVGTDGSGAFVSHNLGKDWASVNINHTINEVHCIATHGNQVFACIGNPGGKTLFQSIDEGETWLPRQRIVSNAMVFKGNKTIIGGKGTGIGVSMDGGLFFAKNSGLTSYQVSSLALSGDLIFAGTAEGVFLSSDDCESWSEVNNGLSNLQVSSLAVMEGKIYAGTADGVFSTSNNGALWNHVSNGLPNPEVLSLAISGNDLYTGTSKGVFTSADEGNNWTDANLGLPAGANVLALVSNGDSLLAGTEQEGIFLSRDKGNNWSQINDGLEFLTVNQIALDGNTIYLGTHKGGVFKRSLSEIGVPVIANHVKPPLIEIYPNPASDHIVISAPNQMQATSIYSTEGKLIRKEMASTMLQEIDIQQLLNGMYILVVATTEGLHSMLFVKQGHQ